MEIAKNIYESVVEPSYKKTTREDANHSGNRRQMRGVFTLWRTYNRMCKHAGKHKQRYVDHPRDRSRINCLIHGHVNFSEKCKLLNEFGTRYS